ncbi:MAG TPA: DedA family protein [Noviherbaspirillum sp.]|jgi:membrane protein DedA with SNARE-associated domain|uniref:DedA family protein n=1 Tax=Noviherbaspirillum sp. TaxID=1926288 RepID=UPI002F9468B4
MFDMLVKAVETGGYLGIFLLMVLENIFPPIPSELIMPLAGFVAARGELNPVAVVVVGTAGSVTGALPWYYAGVKLSECGLEKWADKHGQWLTISSTDVRRATAWFEKHGRTSVFLGRLVPAVRTLISVPAGIFKLPIRQFLLYSLGGSFIWTALLTVAGYLLSDRYALVGRFLDPVTKLVLGLIIATYVYRLMKQTMKNRK